MRALFHTVRFRLTLWYALVLSFALAASGAFTYALVRYQLVRHHDADLKGAAAEVGRVLSSREDCRRLTDSQRKELDRISSVILFHELADESRIFYRSPDSSGVTRGIDLHPLDNLEEPRFAMVPGHSGDLRVYSQPYRSRAGCPGLIHVIESLGEITAPLASLRLALLLLAPLAVALSAALAALVRFGEEGGWRPAALAVLSFAAQFLAGEQMALLSLPFLLLAGLVALAEQRFRARSIATLGALAILGAIVLAPIARTVSSFHEKYGFTRSEEVVAALSAQTRDFTTRPSSSRLAFPPREDSYMGDTGGLFPGFFLLGLGAAGACLGWRQGERRLWIVCLLVCAAGGGLLALGLNLRIGDWRPFASLREVVPGLRTLRSPFRAVAISQAVLAALAALALARLSSWRGNVGRILALVLGVLAATENLASPGALVPTPATPRTAWTSWLREQPGKLIVAHVPLPRGLHVSDYEVEAWRMFAQIDHHRPLLNGYSGYFPSGYGTFQVDMDQNFPSDRLLYMMAFGMGVNTLILDRPYLEQRRALFESDNLRVFFRPEYSDPSVVIVRLSPPPEACGVPPS